MSKVESLMKEYKVDICLNPADVEMLQKRGADCLFDGAVAYRRDFTDMEVSQVSVLRALFAERINEVVGYE